MALCRLIFVYKLNNTRAKTRIRAKTWAKAKTKVRMEAKTRIKAWKKINIRVKILLLLIKALKMFLANSSLL